MHRRSPYRNMKMANDSSRWQDIVEMLYRHGYFEGAQFNYFDAGHIDIYDIEIGWESGNLIGDMSRIGISACFDKVSNCEILLYWPYIDEYSDDLWNKIYDTLDKILDPFSKEHQYFVDGVVDYRIDTRP